MPERKRFISSSATPENGYQIDEIDGIPFLSFPSIKDLEKFCGESKRSLPSEKCVVGKCVKLNLENEKCDFAPPSLVCRGDGVSSTVVKSEGK